MKKVMLVFAMVMFSLAIAEVKAEGAINGNDTVKGIANSVVVEDAQENADSVIYKFRIRLRDMNKAMHLDVDQVDELRFANGELTRSIARLKFYPAAQRQAKLASILAENLAAVREIVDEDQYRAYLFLLNTEFNKCGLSNVLYGYNQLASK